MAVLRILSLLGWLAVFAILLLFAIKNTEPATLLATLAASPLGGG